MKTGKKHKNIRPLSLNVEKLLTNMVAGKVRSSSKARKNELRKSLLRLKKEFYDKVPRETRVRELVDMALVSARLSPDGIARVLVHEDLIHDAGNSLYELQREGRIGEITWASPLEPIARKAQLTWLVILPRRWKNPAAPRRVLRFRLREQAKAKAEELNLEGHYARVIRPVDWAKEAPAFDPGRYHQRLKEYESGQLDGWIVQEWDPSVFLKYVSTTYSQAELLDALKDLANPDNQERFEQASRRLTGTTKNKARAQGTADAQRALFEKYRNGEVSTDGGEYSLWDKNTLIKHIAALNRGKKGWSVRSMQNKLTGIEFPKLCVPRVSPEESSGRTTKKPANKGRKVCPPK